jgi:protein phosphatase
VRVEAAGVTDRGLIRDNNEDALLVDTDSGLFFVADGMGGLDAGEVASGLALRTVARCLGRGAEAPTVERPPFGAPWWRACADRLERAVSEANRAVLAESRARFGAAGATGMGTPLVGLSLCGQGFVVANVGDSRATCTRRNRVPTERGSLPGHGPGPTGLLTLDGPCAVRNAMSSTAPWAWPRRWRWISPRRGRSGDCSCCGSDGLTDVVDDAGLSRICPGPATTRCPPHPANSWTRPCATSQGQRDRGPGRVSG